MSVLAINKMAWQAYHIQQTWQAGLILSGPEVRSAKAKHVEFKGSYISFRTGLPVIKGFRIAPYAHAQTVSLPPDRDRGLLLSKKEINEIIGKITGKGLTIIPLKLYTKGGLIKLEIGLASSKSKHDKRAIIKKREIDRDIRRRLREKSPFSSKRKSSIR